MNSQDYRNLQEAYLNVYENEQLDELSVNKMHDYINKAEKDRDRLNKKWDQGTATSKERKKVFDREEGESRASKKIRQKTGKDSFRLNALDKLKSAITKEEVEIFDTVLEFLYVEGYAETLEEAEWLMANVIDEEALDEVSDKLATAARNLRQKRYTKSADQARNLQLSKGNRADMFYKNFDKTVKLNDTLKSREKRTGTKIPRVEQLDLYDIILSHLLDEGYADTEQAAERIMVNMSEEWRESIFEEVEQLDELSVNKMLAYVEKGEKNRADLNKKWDKGTATHRERMRVLGREEGEKRASDKVEKKTGKRPYQMNALDKVRYAVTKEDYMDEAQEARNNPEKYEREQSKKYAPVRGERTPMPPRGNKRREDFEKWYAANVR